MYHVDLHGAQKEPVRPFTQKNIATFVRPAKFQTGKVIQQGDLLLKRCKKGEKISRAQEVENLFGSHIILSETKAKANGLKIEFPEDCAIRHESHPEQYIPAGIYEYGTTLNFANHGGRD